MLQFGHSEFKNLKKAVNGELVTLKGDDFYKIGNFDRIKPFLMSVTSASDHWMFLSSNGNLTCGRKNAAHALFPYYSDDKIYDGHTHTGPKTFIKVSLNGHRYYWEPFNTALPSVYHVERNLYKSIAGNKVIFEEVNPDLKLVFRYSWMNSHRYGFIRETSIESLESKEEIKIEILDGLLNLLPPDVNTPMQANMSTLIDAYKVNILQEEYRLGLYFLSSAISDRAEALESLQANIVWTVGLNPTNQLLSGYQIENFREDAKIETEDSIKGQRGAYFSLANISLKPRENKRWLTIADVDQSHVQIQNLKNRIKNDAGLFEKILKDIEKGDYQLKSYVAKADGIQHNADKKGKMRHFSNVLFNIMRGGFFPEDYTLINKDFADFLEIRNKKIHQSYKDILKELPKKITTTELIDIAKNKSDADLERLVFEYLPLSFSRRHGDPSRPWNKFNIQIHDKQGEMRTDYQGNWRDIFQNWEALLYSFPGFIEHVVVKFLNASTLDGYNPYRITHAGIDWELFDPEDPWSNIGYWGDHQLIYLLRLLEMLNSFFPGRLETLLSNPVFVFANVPYRVKDFYGILENPYDTVVFSDEAAKVIEERTTNWGSDGKLVFEEKSTLLHSNMITKLLLTTLTKLSNFIPGAGIWMNTQRPEWNDANNALVGNGTSMVTLFHLRKFLSFLSQIIQNAPLTSYALLAPVTNLLTALKSILQNFENNLLEGFTPKDRLSFASEMGLAATAYRSSVYNSTVDARTNTLSKKEITTFFDLSLKFIDQTIAENRRTDMLYHSYNLLEFKDESMQVHHLQEMLEGQVAALNSGFLSPDEALKLINQIRQSRLYRRDQQSYMLYPNEHPETFLEKNNITAGEVDKNPLLKALTEDNVEAILEKDENKMFHFAGDIKNKQDINKKLAHLAKNGYQQLVDQYRESILDLFENIFNHRAFTGRSGRFFKYEGLGSIYWHMVSKYGLAVIENIERDDKAKVSDEWINSYKEIKEGLGVHKSPDQYGAFPTDPYSHTPAFAGAQQPGMTGQVKEDIIARWHELGIKVNEGKLHFILRPFILNDFEEGTKDYTWIDMEGAEQTMQISGKTMFFTFCQIPVIYKLDEKPGLHIHFTSGKKLFFSKTFSLSQEHSREIYYRTKKIACIEVVF